MQNKVSIYVGYFHSTHRYLFCFDVVIVFSNYIAENNHCLYSGDIGCGQSVAKESTL